MDRHNNATSTAGAACTWLRAIPFRRSAAKTALILFVSTMWLLGCKTNATGPGILFLAWDKAGVVQLFWHALDAGSSRQLTNAEAGVSDYSASPTTPQVAYSTAARQDRTMIRILDLEAGTERSLLTCSRANCSAIVWHPDVKRLLYERRSLGSDGIPGLPQLWWLNLDSGETQPFRGTDAAVSSAARFSPDGSWLSYSGDPSQGVTLYETTTGSAVTIASDLGTPVTWNPGGTELIFQKRVQLILHGDEGSDHQEHTHDSAETVSLFSHDISSQTSSQLIEGLVVEDGTPSYSPDGRWIAFGRAAARTATPRHLWLVDAGGTDARQLTFGSHLTHGPPVWLPDSSTIIFQRFDHDRQEAGPAIWSIDIQTGTSREQINAGFSPTWYQPPGG